MGDFDTKIGNKEYLQPVAGPHTIHDFSNENGNMLIQFAIRNRLIIKSTMFPHKHIYLGTWRIPGSNEVNRIYHAIASSVIDVRSCRGPNCNSDNYLVKIKVRERLANVQKIPRRKTRRWEVEKLHKDIAQRDKYQKVLDLKLKQKNGRRRRNRQCTKEMGTFGTGNKSYGRGNHSRNKIQKERGMI